ncbi:dTDP-glucose 4,6-dehydratase [Corynebacterium sp. 4HC-13]|uniref:dTDP-glucose 4,6-dehydratase n=1 Tax=Corynebacterium anserum TaxID=2684406 RepID=UPI00163A0D60|nr:dTDP-glucose 4,6-dehydratase [Corynebacterium anserum]MBC2682300.1 dTDP-glucose 4,6-dehydratase [Corynebacterium anserum]
MSTEANTRTFTHLLVTGGAGFIGSNFVHRTLATRPEVKIHVLDALTYAANPDNLKTEEGIPLEEAYPGRFTFTKGDIVNSAVVDDVVGELAREASGGDGRTSGAAIVHCAAESHNDNSLVDPGVFARTNVEGTVNLAAAAVRHNVFLHHISTDEVFGDLALDDPQRFTTATPYRPSSPYSASKASADHFIRAFIRSKGLRATVSNCSNNYGPRQHPEKFIPRQITALIEGKKPRLYGQGLNVRDWIHVDDHNDAVWTILEKGTEGETYLIGADGERSNIQVVRDLLRIFGQQPNAFLHVTDRPGHDRRYAIDPISIRSLGWEPVYRSFDAGLRETVAWYQNNQQWWKEARVASEEKYSQTEREL